MYALDFEGLFDAVDGLMETMFFGYHFEVQLFVSSVSNGTQCTRHQQQMLQLRKLGQVFLLQCRGHQFW